MTILEARLVAQLLRWAVSRVVHALGTGTQIDNYRRSDVPIAEAEDEQLIVDHYTGGRFNGIQS